MITLLGTLFGVALNYDDIDDFEMGKCYDTPESRTLISCLGCVLWVEVIWITIKSIFAIFNCKK